MFGSAGDLLVEKNVHIGGNVTNEKIFFERFFFAHTTNPSHEIHLLFFDNTVHFYHTKQKKTFFEADTIKSMYLLEVIPQCLKDLCIMKFKGCLYEISSKKLHRYVLSVLHIIILFE